MALGLALPGLPLVEELSAAAGVREALQWFAREKRWINEQHLQLCRIPAPTFLEEQRAEWVAEQLRSYGWRAEIDRAGNVTARPGPDLGEPLVALTAHLDTVLAPRRPEDIGSDADGVFRGPGVSDNGAGLAALLAIARAVKASPPLESMLGGLLLVANVGEEGEGNLSGMRYLCGPSPLASRIKTFLVLDGPAVGHITTQALAIRRFEVLFSGPGGHSWTDYGNANPVHALSAAIASFAGDWPANGSGGPRSSFNFGTLEGGASVNSIPPSARAEVDFRSESGAEIDKMVGRLASTVERARDMENQRATGGKLTAKLKELGSRPEGRLAEDARLLHSLRVVDATLGIRAQTDCASTDANIPLAMGLPALSIGAGGQGGGAHTASEWYNPEGRDLGLRRILLTLCLLLRE